MYALAVDHGVVIEAYEIEHWQPAGTAAYVTRPERKDPAGRWEFVGRIAPAAIRLKYCGGSVKHYFKRGNQSPHLVPELLAPSHLRGGPDTDCDRFPDASRPMAYPDLASVQ